MSIKTRLNHVVKMLPRTIYSILPFEGINNPIFIIGCGRSGTTILGTTLSQHKQVTYLNEPRHLWLAAYPEADIWTKRASSRNGKLVLTDADVDSRKSQKLKRLFRFETLINMKPVLIEKLPINNFRLKLIHEIFPDARFIHIYRNGLEVARSIQKACEGSLWFGANSYKWDSLVKYASTKHESSDIASLCSNYYEMGLLEWRLSTEAAVDFLGDITTDVYFELSYDELNQNPVESISRILQFIGIDNDQNVINFASEKIARRTNKVISEPVTDKETMIGGKLLRLSMDGQKGLTRCMSRNDLDY